MSGAKGPNEYRLAVVAKDLENIFFTDVGRGCKDRADHLTASNNDGHGKNVTCLFVGSPTGDKPERNDYQIAIVEYLLEKGDLDGMAIAVTDADDGEALIKKALSRGIPTITYNVDSADSGRMAFVGTDSHAQGVELANTLLQSKPDGGTYAIVDRESTVIKEIAHGVRTRLTEEGSWVEATTVSPLNCQGKGDIAQDLIYQAIDVVPDLDAVIAVGSYPVREQFIDGWRLMVKDIRFEKVTFVVATERQGAIELLKEGYIDSLVGTQPYSLGTETIDRLYELRLAQQGLAPVPFVNGTIFRAPLISFLEVDAYLQSPIIERNYLGNLVVMGYVFLAIILVLSLALLGTITYYRKHKVFVKSQPFFLYMVIVGGLIFASTIVPLGFDAENFSHDQCSIACTAAPWLFSIGLTTMMSALYAKTHRINQVMKASKRFRRVEISIRDVLKPFALLMMIITTILVCWAILAPADYTEQPASGTDHWNRVHKSFYGTCYTNNQHMPYQVTLLLSIGGSICVLAVEAFLARKVETEYAESSYIGIVIFSLCQAWIMTLPILILLDQQNTRARYVIQVLCIFLLTVVTLCLIFVPKLLMLRKLMLSGNDPRSSVRSSISGLSQITAGGGLRLQTYELTTNNHRGTSVVDRHNGNPSDLTLGSHNVLAS